MAPTSNIRKASTATSATVTHANDPHGPPRRTTSGRTIRANTTRPTNYYAKPFGFFHAASAANTQEDIQDLSPPGFYPAIQFFADAIAALPKEVQRPFTLLKETESKVHGPNEKISEIVDKLMEAPVPVWKSQQGTATHGSGLMSLTANNSTTGSTNASLINGIAPRMGQHSTQNSIAGSLNDDEQASLEMEEELTKRKQFLELRILMHNSYVNLDEKNAVLTTANRILTQQMSRIDSVMPHVDEEISEEARLGSMSHWAYSDNRQRKQTADPAANRRNVAATHNLAAAASAIHENEIAQARRDAVRETTRDKQKGRGREHESDFDDKSRRPHTKVVKRGAGQAGSGALATPNGDSGEPVKKRKVEKPIGGAAMERSVSAVTKGAKSSKDAIRNTPSTETNKKPKSKPAPLSKRKGIGSAQASPALASSPIQATFTAPSLEPAVTARPQSARARQGSAATNLRRERVADDESSRPVSAAGKTTAEKTNGKKKAQDEPKESANEPEVITKSTETGDDLKHEDMEMVDAEQQGSHSQSGSNSGRSAPGTKPGTPRTESFQDAPPMSRTRSTRSMRGPGRDESSSEPISHAPSRHKRVVSNSHLVKQLAPFNRSPDLDRHKKDDMDEDLESAVGREEGKEGEQQQELSPRKRPRSRRNTDLSIPVASSPPNSDRGDRDVAAPNDLEEDNAHPNAAPFPTAPEHEEPEPEEQPVQPVVPEASTGDDNGAPDLKPDTVDELSEAELEPEPVAETIAYADAEAEPEAEGEAEDEDSDPDDDPQKYCYCNRGSYGEMVACDNESCPREWFHLGCTELKEAPPEDQNWYCAECRPLFVRKKAGRSGRSGR